MLNRFLFTKLNFVVIFECYYFLKILSELQFHFPFLQFLFRAFFVASAWKQIFTTCLAYFSWKLCDILWHLLSSVRPYVCSSIRLSSSVYLCKLSTFYSSSPEPLSHFQQTLPQNIIGLRWSSMLKWRFMYYFKGR